MPVTRSNRVAIKRILTFHKEDNEPRVAYGEKEIQNISLDRMKKDIDESSIYRWEWELYYFFRKGYFSGIDVKDLGRYNQISLRRIYIDNLTGEVLFRKFVGSYKRVCENKYEKEEFIQNYMKTDKSKFARSAGEEKYFMDFVDDHFEMKAW